MNRVLTPEELFARLAAIDPELPRLTLTLSQPCPHCDCGLKDALDRGCALEVLAETYVKKQEKCNSAIKTSFSYLLNHPVIHTVSGIAEPQKLEDVIEQSVERERVQP
jgi:hypothetical protein